MKYTRQIDNQIISHFQKYREILILLGSRQCGKTTLLKRLFPNSLYLLVDNEPIRKILESYDINVYKSLVKDTTKTTIIDEIHLLSDPGRAAKIIYDQIPGVQLIITGSSSLNIKNRTSESLSGRRIEYRLFPLTFPEYLYQNEVIEKLNIDILDNIFKIKKSEEKKYFNFDLQLSLNEVILYGLYPNMINYPRDINYLTNFSDSLIYKDILNLNLIENQRLAGNLLKLLAYQIGNLINYSELSDKLNADQRTIKKYLEIFEQSFILYRLYPYSSFKRDEITKSPKIYFYDLGLRNAIINDFSDPQFRSDKGALFENFIITECIKSNWYSQSRCKFYYWRTKQKSEIDLVIEKEKSILGVEIKYKRRKANQSFLNRYPKAEIRMVTSENFI
jgi:uncharacterized protein